MSLEKLKQSPLSEMIQDNAIHLVASSEFATPIRETRRKYKSSGARGIAIAAGG